MEGDIFVKSGKTSFCPFQSTPSVWRATTPPCRRGYIMKISIHTLRVEGDSCPSMLCSFWLVISIHTLRVEGDRQLTSSPRQNGLFQSTPSVWRATETLSPRLQPDFNFNPHPPCGGRQSSACICLSATVFQSTPSVWRATQSKVQTGHAKAFQSTPSVWRATKGMAWQGRHGLISIHTLRVEGDTFTCDCCGATVISIHTLRVEGDCQNECRH